MTPQYYNVAPRFTPGSPGMVGYNTALHVALEEREARDHAATGVYGAEDQAKANAPDALRGIVEARVERAGCWLVEDLITGDHFVRPFEVVGETPLRTGRRLARLRAKYGLPIEHEAGR